MASIRLGVIHDADDADVVAYVLVGSPESRTSCAHLCLARMNSRWHRFFLSGGQYVQLYSPVKSSIYRTSHRWTKAFEKSRAGSSQADHTLDYTLLPSDLCSTCYIIYYFLPSSAYVTPKASRTLQERLHGLWHHANR